MIMILIVMMRVALDKIRPRKREKKSMPDMMRTLEESESMMVEDIIRIKSGLDWINLVCVFYKLSEYLPLLVDHNRLNLFLCIDHGILPRSKFNPTELYSALKVNCLDSFGLQHWLSTAW